MGITRENWINQVRAVVFAFPTVKCGFTKHLGKWL